MYKKPKEIKIRDDEKRQRLEIDCVVDGKRHRKVFNYANKCKEAVLNEAVEWKNKNCVV